MNHKCTQCGITYDANPRKFVGEVFCPVCGLLKDGSGYTNQYLVTKPNILGATWLVLPAVASAFFFYFGVKTYPANGYLRDFIIGIIALLVLIFGVSVQLSMRKDYKLALRDNKAFQKRKGKEIESLKEAYDKNEQEQIERQKIKAEQEADRLSRLPVCPICNSKANVRRISTIDRSVSATVWGLGSSKIGKQYECTHCKHYF